MRDVEQPIKRAFETWADYSQATENLVHLSHKGIAWALRVPDLYRVLEKDEATITRAEWEADQARPEVEAGFPNLHAHTLLGLCGALESFVEDLVAARLESTPHLLANDAFARLKVPVSLLVTDDVKVRNRRIVQDAGRALDADLATGVTRYERLLRLVELSGEVPVTIKTAIFRSIEIRNVWAHRGGIADERFAQRCGDLGFSSGQKILMSPDIFMPLMHGFHMYAIVILNRYLASLGRPPVNNECDGYEGSLAELSLTGADGAS